MSTGEAFISFFKSLLPFFTGKGGGGSSSSSTTAGTLFVFTTSLSSKAGAVRFLAITGGGTTALTISGIGLLFSVISLSSEAGELVFLTGKAGGDDSLLLSVVALRGLGEVGSWPFLLAVGTCLTPPGLGPKNTPKQTANYTHIIIYYTIIVIPQANKKIY